MNGARATGLAALMLASYVAIASIPPLHAQTTRQQEQLLDSLRREVTDRLLATGKFAAVTVVDPMSLKARKLSEGDVTFNLGNTWSAVNARPKERAEIVRRLVMTILATATESAAPPPQTKAQFVASLRLLVRHKDYTRIPPQSASGTPKGPTQAPLSRPFAGDAFVIVALDRGESLLMATPGSGAPHDLTDDDLYALARAEMHKLKDDVTREAYGPLRFYGATEGSFSPSLLLIDDFWSEVEKDLGAAFLVAIPDRTLLLAAPLKNASDLSRAVQSVTQQRKTAPHIAHLIQRQAGGWVRYPR